MLTFWLVLAAFGLLISAMTRVYFWLLLSVALLLAAGMEWTHEPYWQQGCVALLLMALFIALRQRFSSHSSLPSSDYSPLGMIQPGNADGSSAFADEPNDVMIKAWQGREASDVEFRGRSWQARLADGAEAHEGRYRVLEVNAGVLVVDEYPVDSALP